MPMTDRKGRTEPLPAEALASGWRWWGVILALAAGGLVLLMTTQPASGDAGGTGSSPGGFAGSVLIGLSMAWLLLLGGVVLILRSYCFRALWDGRPVEPGSYLKGMYQVWGVLAVGALLAVLGALLMKAMMPGGLVVMGAILLLIFARPSGRALGL
ncbi:MAG: hypothetical protein ACE37H_01480 [Phycisphaeraceae bacterium]